MIGTTEHRTAELFSVCTGAVIRLLYKAELESSRDLSDDKIRLWRIVAFGTLAAQGLV